MGFTDLELKYANEVIADDKQNFDAMYDHDVLKRLRTNKELRAYIDNKKSENKSKKLKAKQIRAERIAEHFDKAIDALVQIVTDASHKDRLKAVEMILAADLVYRKQVGSLLAEQDVADKDQKDKKATVNISVIK